MAGPLIHLSLEPLWATSKAMLTTILSILVTGAISFCSWVTVNIVTLKTKNDDLVGLINERFDGVDQRLDRIERKQDKN